MRLVIAALRSVYCSSVMVFSAFVELQSCFNVVDDIGQRPVARIFF